MLSGELEYRRGRAAEAMAHLRRATALEDGLPYDEPWGWMQPTRHAHGALLLEQGRVAEAAAVYAADLGLDGGSLPRPLQHHNTVWALHGYHECLTRLGRGAEARIVKQQLDLALAAADVPITSSCFCRGSAPADEADGGSAVGADQGGGDRRVSCEGPVRGDGQAGAAPDKEDESRGFESKL